MWLKVFLDLFQQIFLGIINIRAFRKGKNGHNNLQTKEWVNSAAGTLTISVAPRKDSTKLYVIGSNDKSQLRRTNTWAKIDTVLLLLLILEIFFLFITSQRGDLWMQVPVHGIDLGLFRRGKWFYPIKHNLLIKIAIIITSYDKIHCFLLTPYLGW